MKTTHERAPERTKRSEHETPSRKPETIESPVLSAPGLALDALGNRALLSLLRSGRLQRKAVISEPGDPLEHEADRAADAVVSGKHPARPERHSPPAEVQRMGTEEQQLTESLGLGGEGGRVAPALPPPPDQAGSPGDVIGQLPGGRSLDEATLGLMESRFGESFSDVRIHTGPRASETAGAVESRAFTAGEDIVFAEGEFAPETTEGLRLLAHELAHVVQQRRPLGAIAEETEAERDARDAAHEVVGGGTPEVRERAAPGTVQKQDGGEIATSKPSVNTSTSPIHTEASHVYVTLEGKLVAAGETSSFDHPHDDKGKWDSGTRTLTVRVFLAAFGKLKAAGGASKAIRDLQINVVVIIPVVDGVEEDPIFISAAPPEPKPPAPKPPPPKKPPVPPPVPDPQKAEPGPEVIPAADKTQQAQTDLQTLREHLAAGAPDVEGLAANLSDADMTQLQLPERVKLLQALGDNSFANQNTVLRLLGTTPVNDARSVLDALRADNAKLAQQFVNGFDWMHARALHQTLQLLYNTSLFYGLTITDLEKTPIAPWPSSTIHYDDIVLTPDGRVQFKVRQDKKDAVPFQLDIDPFSPVRTRPMETIWLGPRRYAITPGINLLGLDDPQLQTLLPTREGIGPSPFDDLFAPRPRLPIYGGEDFLTQFIQGPAPSKPFVPLTPAVRDRVTRVIDGMNSLAPWREQTIAGAFSGTAPDEFQQMHDSLGPEGMTKLFGQLSPFAATLVGSHGAVEYGRVELNDKRAEFIIGTKDWGAQKGAFYHWMFDTMSNDDIRSVLHRLAQEKRLNDTILSVPGLAEKLKRRGVDVAAISQEKLTVLEGAGRGAAGLWSSAWSQTVFSSGPGFEHTYLPAPYQDLYLAYMMQQWNEAMTKANITRGVASYVTLGISDIPVGVYEAGKSGVGGIIDIASGKSGEGTEKLVPAVVMILTAVLGRKLAKGGAAGKAGAAEAAATESKEFTLPEYKGPKSAAAARVEATLKANPLAAAAGAELVDSLGAEAVEKAAGYIQENSAAARFVAKNGIPGVRALVAANGDVAAAEAALSPVPAAPKALPQGPSAKVPAGPGLPETPRLGRQKGLERAARVKDLVGAEVGAVLETSDGAVIDGSSSTVVQPRPKGASAHYKHAEIDALIEAGAENGKLSGKSATLYVTEHPCAGACLTTNFRGNIVKLFEQSGMTSLTIHSSEATIVLERSANGKAVVSSYSTP